MVSSVDCGTAGLSTWIQGLVSLRAVQPLTAKIAHGCHGASCILRYLQGTCVVCERRGFCRMEIESMKIISVLHDVVGQRECGMTVC